MRKLILESSSGTSTEVREKSALEVAMGFEVGGELWGGKVTGEIRQQFEHESTSGFTWIRHKHHIAFKLLRSFECIFDPILVFQGYKLNDRLKRTITSLF